MSSLPAFPKFARLEINHKDTLRKIAEEFPTYSDFNFVSLFTWDNAGAIYVSDLNGNLAVRFSDYTTSKVFLSFLGINRVSETIDLLLKYCAENNIETKLHLIGQSVIDVLSKSDRVKYLVEEDRDNHDYILSTSILSDINKAHPKKRTKYRHFEREQSKRVEFHPLDLGSKATLAEIEELLLEWQKKGLKKDADVNLEFSAIRRGLTHAKELNMSGYGTFVGKQLEAFTLFEIVHNKTAMLHFGKNNHKFTGLNEFHHNSLARYLVTIGIEFMNNEQDLGIEGLRHAKMSSQPISFLKKYTISPIEKKFPSDSNRST